MEAIAKAISTSSSANPRLAFVGDADITRQPIDDDRQFPMAIVEFDTSAGGTAIRLEANIANVGVTHLASRRQQGQTTGWWKQLRRRSLDPPFMGVDIQRKADGTVGCDRAGARFAQTAGKIGGGGFYV